MELYRQIEKDLTGSRYRKKIWRPFMAAIREYRLIEAGDSIAVCISGGKDSILLAKCMQEFRKHSPLKPNLRFICMDPGYASENRRRIAENCEKLRIPVEFFETDIFEAVDRMDCNPCFMCAKMRRGYLYRYAESIGCNKIALGHHYDDAVETILMSMLYAGQMRGMRPMIESENVSGMRLIRPLYRVREREIIAWRDENEMRFLNCACKRTQQGVDSKRSEMKNLVRQLETLHPDAARNIFRSAHSVALDHLISWKHGGVEHSFLDE